MQSKKWGIAAGVISAAVLLLPQYGFAAGCDTPLTNTENLQVKVAVKNIRKIQLAGDMKTQQESLLKKLQTKSCGNGKQGFSDASVSSYKAVKSEIVSFLVRSATASKKQSDVVLQETIIPIKQLSANVKQYFGILSPDMQYVMQTSNSTIDFTVKEDDMGTFQGKLNAKAEGKFDLIKGYFDMVVAGDISFSLKNPFVKTPASVYMKGNINLVHNGGTYVKFNELALDLTLPEILASELGGASSSVSQLKKRFADIPTRTKDTYIALGDTPAAMKKQTSYFPQEWGKFTYKEGDTYYGMPSAEWCNMMASDTFTDARCQKAMKNIALWTQGKGIMYMRMKDGIYTMGLTKKFIGKNVIQSIPANWYDKDLITWDANKIIQVNMPLDKAGTSTFTYDGQQLQINYSDKKSTFSVKGPLSTEQAVLQIVFTDKIKKTDGTGNFTMTRAKTSATDSSWKGEGKISMKQAKREIASFSFTSTMTQKATSSFVPATPKKTMTFDAFIDMMEMESFIQ